MKIDANLLLPNDQSAERISNAAVSSDRKLREEAPSRSDKVRLSSDKETIQALKTSLDGLDVRWDRIVALRRAIQSGTYHVTDQQLAEAMLDDFFTVTG
jgi:flagellar biosynthesis anti-sigma factor FlgM